MTAHQKRSVCVCMYCVRESQIRHSLIHQLYKLRVCVDGCIYTQWTHMPVRAQSDTCVYVH